MRMREPSKIRGVSLVQNIFVPSLRDSVALFGAVPALTCWASLCRRYATRTVKRWSLNECGAE